MFDVGCKKKRKGFLQSNWKNEGVYRDGEKQERNMYWGEYHFSFSQVKFEMPMRLLSGNVD